MAISKVTAAGIDNIAAAVEGASDSNKFTDADHSKLNAIEASATADQTAAQIKAAVESASDSNTFTDADHSKLNAIEASATADQTDAQIRTAVEAASDSNVFTDADHSKLNAVEANATADQTAAQIKTALENGIDSVHYVDGSIDGAHIANDAIDSQHYAAGSINYTAYLGADVVTTSKILNDAVTADKLANSINTAIAANTAKTGITSSQATAITAALPKAGGTLTGVLKGVAGSVSAPSFAFSSNLNTGLGFVTNKGLFGTAMGLKVFQVEKINNNPHFAIGRDSNFSDNSNVMSLELGGSASLTSNVAVGEFSGTVLQTNSRYTDSGDLAIATGRVTRAAQYYGAQWFDYASASAGAGITWKRSLTLDYGGAVTIGSTSVADPVLLIQSSSSGDAQLHLSSAGANRSGRIKFLDNGSAVGGFIQYQHNGDKMEFGSGSSTTVGFRVCDGYSNAAQGLTFGSDTAAANTLDDYEEGMWTMTAVGASTPAGQSAPTCTYVKVGQLVTCYGMWWGASLSGTATAGIAGFPFAAKAGTYITGTTGANTFVEYGGSCWGYTHSNVYLMNNHTMGEGTNRSGAPRYLSFSITYRTT